MSADAMQRPGAPAGTANVLVVDDVAENLVAMSALLRRDGVTVLCAGSGAEALEILLQHEVAVALLDVHMPEMDGIALAELMRGSPRSREVPIIFLTASSNDPVRTFKGYEAGAVDFLHKPVEPHVIAGKVNVFVELYRQRQLLRERAESLERALALNDTMVAVLTHDLRTPLAAMLLGAERVAEQLPQDHAALRMLRQMEQSGWRMARMVEQLLDFSRIRTGGLRLAPCDCGELVSACVDEARRAHPDADIALELGDGLGLHADADRLSQIVSNLLSNAVIHGGGTVRVQVRGDRGDRVAVAVSNPGAIDEPLLSRLFEPFKGSSREGQGLGLGLFIADQFVQAHGGQLRVANEEGWVRFTAWLPRSPAGDRRAFGDEAQRAVATS